MREWFQLALLVGCIGGMAGLLVLSMVLAHNDYEQENK